VREDRVNDGGIDTAREQDLSALHGMVRRARVHFVVEVVEHARDPPRAFVIRTIAAGVGAHRRFDGARVLAEALAFRELGQN
jgi:hypothetical protein